MRGMLRKAGKTLLDLDEAYARKLVPDQAKQPVAAMTRGSSIRDFMESENFGDSQVEKLVNSAALGGLATANIASRYALPAGGVTLAGAALVELAGQIGEQTQQTVMPQ